MYATFALQEQVGGRGKPFLVYWILEDDEQWHNVVRGDGHSYRPSGRLDMKMYSGETKEQFIEKIQRIIELSELYSHEDAVDRLKRKGYSEKEIAVLLRQLVTGEKEEGYKFNEDFLIDAMVEFGREGK